jgi:hypothetical protein
MRRFLKRRKVMAATFVALLAITASAIAYWTTTGSGTGSATTGAGSAVTVTQVGTVTGLVPGGTAQAVDFTVTNPKSTPQYVTTVSYSIASIQTSPGVAAVGCSAADFTLVQPSAISTDLAAGVTTFSPSGATLAMKDTGSNQDGCKNVTVNLTFAAV